MVSRRRRRKSGLEMAAELAIAVPTVIALRSTRMLDPRECNRMWREKNAAYWESMHAMYLGMWTAPWSAAASVLSRGMAPYHRRATRNARRLSRRRRRR